MHVNGDLESLILECTNLGGGSGFAALCAAGTTDASETLGIIWEL